MARSGARATRLSSTAARIPSSRPAGPFPYMTRSLFQAHNLNPTDFDMVVVKSPHCQHRPFAAYAERILNIDAPGATSANLPTLGHTRCARPVFPLDEGVEFQACPKIYQSEFSLRKFELSRPLACGGVRPEADGPRS